MGRNPTVGLKTPELIARVLAGDSVKCAALDVGISPSYAYNRLVALGWRALMLTPTEHANIMSARAQHVSSLSNK